LRSLTAAEPLASSAVACSPGVAEVAIGCELESQDHPPESWTAEAVDSPPALFNRAMSHELWMRQRLIPAGGVMPAHFTDASYTQV